MNMSSDTPRVDEVCRTDILGGAGWQELVDLARALERELAAAKAERDNALAWWKTTANGLNDCIKQRDELLNKAKELIRDGDEARACLRYLMDEIRREASVIRHRSLATWDACEKAAGEGAK
jgi:uncharacterized coiled-coil DUF342 family protein